MAGTFTALHVHLVFSTQDRRPWLDDETLERLFEYCGGILRADDAALVAACGMPDHIHLLVRVPAKRALADLVRAFKSKSSGWIHENYPKLEKFAWQRGYGAFSVSQSDLPKVSAYLARQTEHHRRRDFREEFVEFLKRHDIGYDERYLWT